MAGEPALASFNERSASSVRLSNPVPQAQPTRPANDTPQRPFLHAPWPDAGAVVLLLRLLLLRIGASARASAPRPGSRFAEVHPEKLAVVGVAEPRQFYRDRMSAEHNIPPDRMFGGWEDLVQAPQRLADFAIVATQDRDHVGESDHDVRACTWHPMHLCHLHAPDNCRAGLPGSRHYGTRRRRRAWCIAGVLTAC